VTVVAALPRLRLRSGLAVAGLLSLLAAPGCDDESGTAEAPADRPAAVAPSGELASLAFEVVAYVEPSANNITVLERVRHELKSGFSALQSRQITISQRRQVDIDLKRLSRDTISVVDPATKAARPAVRVRYRFVGLAQVPKELAARGDALLGLLHRDDALHAAEVIDACTSPAARTGDAVKQPWRIFDPSLEPCARAIDAEQASIDAARAGLEHPDREIVIRELERLYLPVVLHVRPRTSAGVSVPGSARASGPAASATAFAREPGAAATGSGSAAVGATPALDPEAALAALRDARLLAKLKESEKSAGDDDDDDREVAEILRRRSAGGLPAGEGGPRTPFIGYGTGAQPLNYTLLWFASIAVIVLLGTEIRRRLLRRGKRRAPAQAKRPRDRSRRQTRR
jgi:hypothetical protein